MWIVPIAIIHVSIANTTKWATSEVEEGSLIVALS